jgi:putative tRNA adenosine deaminase-associated protein
MDDLISTLRQLPGEGGVFGLIGVVDEYFIVVRQAAGSSRAMISDGAAILDWALAEEAADVIGLDIDDDDLEDFEPVGDMSIFADFGLDADELGLLCRDEDLYPDQQIKAIAKRLGFSEQLKSVLRAN